MIVPLATYWSIRRDAPFEWVGRVVDEHGAGLSITGQTITAYLREGRAYNATLKLTLTVEFVDAANGYYRVTCSQAEAAALAAGNPHSPPWWGQVWITGSLTGSVPKQVVEAQPVAVI